MTRHKAKEDGGKFGGKEEVERIVKLMLSNQSSNNLAEQKSKEANIMQQGEFRSVYEAEIVKAETEYRAARRQEEGDDEEVARRAQEEEDRLMLEARRGNNVS